MPGLAEFLLGQTRTRVLSALLLHPEQALHVRELARATGASAGSLHRELRGLGEAGLLLRTEVGRQVHYQANVQSPVYADLASLLRKTAGIADVLRESLLPLGDAVSLAFIYGSVAAGTAGPRSDIDLMLLGSAGLADVAVALSRAQDLVGREINPTPMSEADFSRRLQDAHGFAATVAASPRIWIKGEEHDLAELVEHRKAQGARRRRA